MSDRSDKLLVEDIWESIDKILRYTAGMNEATFKKQEMVVDAVIRNFEIIGEAASKISDEYARAHADVPFRQMTKLRNRLIHGYFIISLHVLWSEISRDIPAWKTQIEKIK